MLVQVQGEHKVGVTTLGGRETGAGRWEGSHTWESTDLEDSAVSSSVPAFSPLTQRTSLRFWSPPPGNRPEQDLLCFSHKNVDKLGRSKI